MQALDQRARLFHTRIPLLLLLLWLLLVCCRNCMILALHWQTRSVGPGQAIAIAIEPQQGSADGPAQVTLSDVFRRCQS
jgi:hypothetical protein